MNCNDSNNKGCSNIKKGNSSFVIVIVLYILLAIIIGSCIF